MAAGGKKGALLKLRKELQRIHKEPPDNIQALSIPDPRRPNTCSKFAASQSNQIVSALLPTPTRAARLQRLC